MIKLKEIAGDWEKQPEWHGNPELGLDSYKKMFVNPFTKRKVPVFVYGKGNDVHFVVSAGANSEYSYSGGFYPDKPDFDEAMSRVDKLYDIGRLFK